MKIPRRFVHCPRVGPLLQTLLFRTLHPCRHIRLFPPLKISAVKTSSFFLPLELGFFALAISLIRRDCTRKREKSFWGESAGDKKREKEQKNFLWVAELRFEMCFYWKTLIDITIKSAEQIGTKDWPRNMKPVPATFKVGAPGDFHYYLPRTIVIVRHAEYNLVSFYQDMAQPSVEKWDGWHAMRQKGYVKGMIGKISKRGIERTGIHERATTSYVCDSQIILLLLVFWYFP